jgi:hypothetical protein
MVGWACRWCFSPLATDYHHQTSCRRDFCGADPVASEGSPICLSPEQFRIELEQLIYRALSKQSSVSPSGGERYGRGSMVSPARLTTSWRRER